MIHKQGTGTRAHPADLAIQLQQYSPEQTKAFLLSLPIRERADLFEYLQPEPQIVLARSLGRRELAEIVTEMDADDRADLFNRLTPDERETLLPALAQAEREDIRRLAACAEGTAGAIMTSDYATLSGDLSVRQALDVLRREAPDKETIYRTYVIDSDRRLIGSVRLQDLILATPNTKVSDLMERDTLAVELTTDQEEVAKKLARYDEIAIPVVARDGRLVGIVTYDDALDILQEEATEDFHKVGTVGKLAQNLRHASATVLYRKRVVWLAVLVFGNLFSGAGIAYFEDTIAAYVALVFFLPLLIDSGGNAGSQAATLMVRALATGEVVLTDWGRMFGRELLVALGLGVTMALAVAPIGVFRGGPEIALVVALTMVLIVLLGSTIGMCLPFLLSRFRLDPAMASAPLITSIADAAGVITYFTVAKIVLFPQ